MSYKLFLLSSYYQHRKKPGDWVLVGLCIRYMVELGLCIHGVVRDNTLHSVISVHYSYCMYVHTQTSAGYIFRMTSELPGMDMLVPKMDTT